jgi:hypothetical protein
MKEKGEEAIAHFHFMLAGSLQLPRNQQLWVWRYEAWAERRKKQNRSMKLYRMLLGENKHSLRTDMSNIRSSIWLLPSILQQSNVLPGSQKKASRSLLTTN